MRIAQVVTFVSPDGAFGGPVSVAATQCAALAEQGHDVTLFAAAPIKESQSRVVDGYVERLFPARISIPRTGFAGMRAKGMQNALQDGEAFDVAHVHMARDLVTLPAARYFQRAGIPTVLQTHGMIDRSHRLLARVLDAIATTSTLSKAHAVLSLTSEEDEELGFIAPGANVRRIGNGVKLTSLPSYEGRFNEVVFIARLHPRKRAVAFVEMAKLLIAEFPDIDFVLYGPDEGDGNAVEEAIRTALEPGRIRWLGPADPVEVPEILARSLAFVLPSFGEVFPMTMLESFAAGTPTVCTHSLGIVEKVREFGAAIVTDGQPHSLAAAVNSILVNHAAPLRKGAWRYLQEELDIRNVVDRLESIYAATIP